MKRNKKNARHHFKQSVGNHILHEQNQVHTISIKIEGRDVFNLTYVCDSYQEGTGEVIRRLIRAEYERLKRKELCDQAEQRNYRDGEAE